MRCNNGFVGVECGGDVAAEDHVVGELSGILAIGNHEVIEGASVGVVGVRVGSKLGEGDGVRNEVWTADELSVGIALIPYIIGQACGGREGGDFLGIPRVAAVNRDFHWLAIACDVAVSVVTASRTVTHIKFNADLFVEIFAEVDVYFVPIVIIYISMAVAMPTVNTIADVVTGHGIEQGVANLLPLI